MGNAASTRIPCVVQVASITPPQWSIISAPLTPDDGRQVEFADHARPVHPQRGRRQGRRRQILLPAGSSPIKDVSPGVEGSWAERPLVGCTGGLAKMSKARAPMTLSCNCLSNQISGRRLTWATPPAE